MSRRDILTSAALGCAASARRTYVSSSTFSVRATGLASIPADPFLQDCFAGAAVDTFFAAMAPARMRGQTLELKFQCELAKPPLIVVAAGR